MSSIAGRGRDTLLLVLKSKDLATHLFFDRLEIRIVTQIDPFVGVILVVVQFFGTVFVT